MKKFAVMLFLSSLLSMQLHAEGFMKTDKDKKVFVGQKIVHLIDNGTVGIVQSVIGASHIIWYLIFDGGPDFGWHNNPNSEVTQVELENAPPFFPGAYSLGLFQVGGYARDHEGGHSVQSATLGPLYLPTVGLSYLMEGHFGSFMERWADLEGYSPSGYEILKELKLGHGILKNGDKSYNVVTINFSINQEQYAETSSLELEKKYKWLNTNVILPLLEENGSLSDTSIFEIDLLKKEMNLVIDNIALYLRGDQELKWQIKTEQKYLHYESNPLLGLINKKALSWEASYGLVYNLGGNLKIEANAGVNAALERMDLTGSGQTASGLSVGWQYDVAVTLFKDLKLEHSYEHVRINSNSSYDKSFSGIVYTKQRPFSALGEHSRLELGVGAHSNSYKINDERVNQSMFGFQLKLAF